MKTIHPSNRLFAVALLLLSATAVFPSCNKTADFEDLDLLVGRDWQLQSRQYSGQEVIDSCELDDVLRFTDASEFTYSYGTNTCSNDAGDLSPISWKLTDDFSILRMKYSIRNGSSRGSLVLYWEILELSDTALVLVDAIAENNDQVPEIRTYR